jgi:S1-C subfamily serine protease
MLDNTNKTFFAVAVSLLVLNFLPSNGFGELTSRNNQLGFATEKLNPQNQTDNPNQPDSQFGNQTDNPNQPDSQTDNPNQPDSTLASKNTVPVDDLAKPAVVKVFSGCEASVPFNGKTYEVSAKGQGSGFFVTSDGYIITNAHVVKESANPEICEQSQILTQQLISQIAEDLELSPSEIRNNPEQMQEIESSLENARIQPINEVILPNGDQLTFDVKEYGAPIGEGKDVAVIKVQIKNAPVLKLANSEQVKTQDKIIALGYPYLALGDLLDEKSEVEVTVSRGEISSTNKPLRDGSTALQFNAGVTHGNSGGPVLNEQGEVIGITTFGPSNFDGIAFAVTSETIMEFVRSAGITNEQGIVDQLYQEALQHYTQGEYSQAIEKFERVERFFPQHSEISQYLQKTEEQIALANSGMNLNIPDAIYPHSIWV